MKLQYLGTAAAEGIPSMFCSCPTCQKSHAEGGRAIRTRSQALIDGRLMIDWPADAYGHLLRYGIRADDVNTLLFTHTHSDHFYPADFEMLQSLYFAHPKPGYRLQVYGSQDIAPLRELVEKNPMKQHFAMDIHTVTAFRPFEADGYTLTPLPAIHGTEHPFIWVVSDGAKTMLYAHDTDVPADETVAFLQTHGYRFDFASLDCTEAASHIEYSGHMCLERCIETREKLFKAGVADEKTVFCLNHFSHNGKHVLYSEMLPIAEENGFLLSYDGMEVEI